MHQCDERIHPAEVQRSVLQWALRYYLSQKRLPRQNLVRLQLSRRTTSVDWQIVRAAVALSGHEVRTELHQHLLRCRPLDRLA